MSRDVSFRNIVEKMKTYETKIDSIPEARGQVRAAAERIDAMQTRLNIAKKNDPTSVPYLEEQLKEIKQKELCSDNVGHVGSNVGSLMQKLGEDDFRLFLYFMGLSKSQSQALQTQKPSAKTEPKLLDKIDATARELTLEWAHPRPPQSSASPTLRIGESVGIHLSAGFYQDMEFCFLGDGVPSASNYESRIQCYADLPGMRKTIAYTLAFLYALSRNDMNPTGFCHDDVVEYDLLDDYNEESKRRSDYFDRFALAIDDDGETYNEYYKELRKLHKDTEKVIKSKKKARKLKIPTIKEVEDVLLALPGAYREAFFEILLLWNCLNFNQCEDDYSHIKIMKVEDTLRKKFSRPHHLVPTCDMERRLATLFSKVFLEQGEDSFEPHSIRRRKECSNVTVNILDIKKEVDAVIAANGVPNLECDTYDMWTLATDIIYVYNSRFRYVADERGSPNIVQVYSQMLKHGEGGTPLVLQDKLSKFHRIKAWDAVLGFHTVEGLRTTAEIDAYYNTCTKRTNALMVGNHSLVEERMKAARAKEDAIRLLVFEKAVKVKIHTLVKNAIYSMPVMQEARKNRIRETFARLAKEYEATCKRKQEQHAVAQERRREELRNQYERSMRQYAINEDRKVVSAHEREKKRLADVRETEHQTFVAALQKFNAGVNRKERERECALKEQRDWARAEKARDKANALQKRQRVAEEAAQAAAQEAERAKKVAWAAAREAQRAETRAANPPNAPKLTSRNLNKLPKGRNSGSSDDDSSSVAASQAVSMAPSYKSYIVPAMTRHANDRLVNRKPLSLKDAEWHNLKTNCLRSPDSRLLVYDAQTGAPTTVLQKGDLKLYLSRDGTVIKTVLWKASKQRDSDDSSVTSDAGPSSSSGSSRGEARLRTAHDVTSEIEERHMAEAIRRSLL